MQGCDFASISRSDPTILWLLVPHRSSHATTSFFSPDENIELMLSRFSQLARHLARPLPNYAHTSAAAISSAARGVMTSSTADERNSRTIHTAACLIIGDEVLGGKVSFLNGWELVRETQC
jgi:hypothetical protein